MNESRPNSFGIGEATGGLQLKDYLHVAKRRKRMILLPAIATFVLATVICFKLPSTYKAETVVLVDPSKLASNVAPGQSVVDRIGLIRQQVLAQNRLKKLVDDMKLYPELKGKVGEQEILTRMQAAIDVQKVIEPGMPLNAFRISYKGSNPVVVAQVTNQLASAFIEENLKTVEQQVFGQLKFLEDELAKTGGDLKSKEDQLAKLKAANLMDLPDSQGYHVEMLNNLRAQLATAQDRVNRAQQQRVYLQSLMGTIAPTVDLDQNQSPYRQQLQKLEPQLAELQGRYGPKHPDVIKLQAQVNELRQKAEQDERNAPPVPTPEQVRKNTKNPVLTAQLQRLDQEIQEQTAIQDRLQKQIQEQSAKLGNAPILQQKMNDLNRDYDTLKNYYAQLLQRKLNAETAAKAEGDQRTERFVMLEPAQPPEKPFSPNRPLISLGALAAGLVLGIVLAVILELLDGTVRTEKEAEGLYGKPILVAVPQLYSAAEKRRKIVVDVAAAAATVFVCTVVGYGLGMIGARML